jgi:hypothetical protein
VTFVTNPFWFRLFGVWETKSGVGAVHVALDNDCRASRAGVLRAVKPLC